MSLHFVLNVNGEAVGACVIQCLDVDRVTPDPDAVYRYEVTVDQHGPPRSRFTSVVEHRYGDGPWALVQVALGHAAELTRRPSPPGSGTVPASEGTGRLLPGETPADRAAFVTRVTHPETPTSLGGEP